MTVLDSPARVSFVAGARRAECEACASDAGLASTMLVVQHPRGGAVELALCDWCVQAFRRLAAVSGGHVAFALAEGAGPPPAAVRSAPRGARRLSPPVI